VHLREVDIAGQVSGVEIMVEGDVMSLMNDRYALNVHIM
jgi:hypothetical protein